MNRQAVFFTIGVLLIFGIFTFLIQFFSPLQSDDFSFTLYNYQEIGSRYFSWSGRLVADFIGTTLLNIKNKFILSVVQTLGLLGLLYLLSQIPSKIFDQKFNGFSFILVASLYWLFHPDLGQSTFWVVGAAVYMWTGIVVYFYLFLLLRYYYSENKKQLLSTFIILNVFAFMAGCTNENVGSFVAVFGWIVFVSTLIFEKSFDKKLFFAAVISSAGAAVLILAPGNQRRLEHWERSSGINWGEIPLIDKYRQFDSHYFELLIIPFLILIVGYLLILIYKKFKIIKNKKLTFLGISIIFLLFSFFSNEILFLTPAKFVRAMAGPFLFLLFAISLFLFDFQQIFSKKKFFKGMTYTISAIAISFFLFLYFGKVYPLYTSYYEQNQIQVELIQNAKEEGLNEIKIPRIFTAKELKNDRLDMDYFENPKSVAEYYGFHKVEYFTVKRNLTEIKSFDSLHANRLIVEIEMKSPTGFGISLAYKTNSDENFTNENKIWNNLKKSENEFQNLVFELPSDKKITNLRFDIGGDNRPKFEIGKMKIGTSHYQKEILPEDFENYFKPNSAIEFNLESHTFHSLRDKNNPVWPKLEETELLRNELKKFYEK